MKYNFPTSKIELKLIIFEINMQQTKNYIAKMKIKINKTEQGTT